MSVIIRLQNLSWNAHALHIRQFFKGLSIPDGGVHIVGGDLGDAFIAFSTDEDARRAMILNGKELNNVPVKLLLSSKAEMQKVIAVARGTPMDKDERANAAMPRVNISPVFPGSGPMSVSASGPFSQPPPPIPLKPNNLPPGQLASANPSLVGNVNFNQPSTLPFPNNIAPQRGMIQNMPIRGDAPSRYPVPSNLAPVGQQFPAKFGISSRMPQRPDIVFSDRPDILKRDVSNTRPERASIVRYDKVGPEHAPKETPDILKAKPDIVRDERNEDLVSTRSDSRERRNGRRDDDRRREHRDDRRKDERRESSRGVEDRKIDRHKVEEYRSRDRYDEGRRYDDRDRRYERVERRRGDSRDRESRKRDRRTEREDERRYDGRDRGRERCDSRDGEKRAKYSKERDRKDDYHSREGSKQFTASRARYGTRASVEKYRDMHDPGTCAFISEMPLSISYKDVRRVFSREQIRLPENGLKLENDEFGNRNGNAYVMFTSKKSRERAIELDGIFLEGNRIRVERCTLGEFEQAIDSFVPQDNRRKGIDKAVQEFHDKIDNQPDIIPRSPHSGATGRKEFFETCCVMIRNLPSRAERFEVRLFFKSLSITQNGVYIPFDDKGACLGVAYVEFETVAEAEEALRRYDGTEFHNTKHRVDMYPITMEEAKERIEQHKKDFMKGAPQRKVFDRRHERPGDRRDIRRDQHRIEERYRGARHDHRDRSDDHRDRNERQRHSRDRDKWAGTEDGRKSAEVTHSIAKNDQVKDQMITNQKYQCVKLNGLPFHADVGLVEGFFFDLSIRPNGIHVVFFPDARCIGVAYVEFTNMDDCSKALERDNTAIGKRVIRVSPVTEEDMVAELNGHKVNDQYVVSRATQEAPGQPCDVILSNVPYKATMFDVNQFLLGTGFIPESILFEVDQQGNAMGNVKVTFFNSQAAHRALITLLKKQFLGRIIKFKVV